MSTSDYEHMPFPLPDADSDRFLPALPKAGTFGSEVCATMRLYLGILDDLPSEQVQAVSQHIQQCAACASVAEMMQQATRLVAGLGSSKPSPHVDQTIRTIIAVQAGKSIGVPTRAASVYTKGRPFMGDHKRYPRRSHPSIGRRLVGALAVAAVLLLAIVGVLHFTASSPSAPQGFALPTNLTWAGYVLYHSETRLDTNGVRYSVTSYHDLGTGSMHVETVEAGRIDVIVVGSDHIMLGMDMLHHIAQWGTDAWSVDESVFDLAALRSDLQTHQATYLDTDHFRGQTVYRIRAKNGLVLLLSMEYMPVNVLRGAGGPGTGSPMYDKLTLMPASTMASSMWDMSVPAGFKMGILPERP